MNDSLNVNGPDPAAASSSEAEQFYKTVSAMVPNRVALVDDVRFRVRVRGEKIRSARKLIVISTKGLGSNEKKALSEAYLGEMAQTKLSFVVREGPKHLRVRLDACEVSFAMYYGINYLPEFRRRSFRPPNSRTLEVVVNIKAAESERLQTYVRNIIKSPRKVLGRFTMNGTQLSKGRLDDNRPLKDFHNCTSWIATAPIADDGRALMEELGADRQLEVGTNPGWWTNWLAATAAPDRLPFLIYWTPKLLADALEQDVNPGGNFEWNFGKR